MPVKNYGVLKGIAIDKNMEREDKESPHYQILMTGAENEKYRIAVNAKSVSGQTELLYLVDEEFDASAITILPTMDNGYTPINENNREIALDYIRSELFDSSKMKKLPSTKPGLENDLHDLLNKYIPKAINEEATVYIYGSKWEPKSGEKTDKVFDFSPPIGMHNVHMNQGNPNPGDHADDNGIWQDGGILIQYTDKWVAIFLAFQSQSWCTDEDGQPTRNCTHMEREE
ncbi:YukJ family protein [Bacillus pseudomycoides]|uniref:YukJ family protein n=1 Tax=Bacillus pseudomycoides TaxID=64104 RepID=UPI001FB1E65D|nr:YukJ family protein [Bacillus pseudomycoides]